MEAINENKIDFKKERSFGELINATFTFFRQEFRILIKPVLYFLAPVILGISLLLDFITYAGGINPTSNPMGFASAIFSWSNILKILFTVFATYLVMFITLAYIKQYVEKGEISDLKEIREILMRKMLPSFGWLIASGILTIIGFFFLFIPGIFLIVTFVMVLPIIFFEEDRTLTPLYRSYDLINGNWWFTFGLGATYALISYVISGFLSIPLYIIMFVSMASSSGLGTYPDTFTIIYSNVTSTLILLIQVFGSILLSFHYFNLLEKREMPTLLNRIENIE